MTARLAAIRTPTRARAWMPACDASRVGECRISLAPRPLDGEGSRGKITARSSGFHARRSTRPRCCEPSRLQHGVELVEDRQEIRGRDVGRVALPDEAATLKGARHQLGGKVAVLFADDDGVIVEQADRAR